MKYLTLILVIGFSTLSTEAMACKCRTITIQEDFESSQNVMEITVLKLLKKKRNGDRIYIAKVNRQYKGSIISNKVKIKQGTSSCDFYYRVRKSYLFYGVEVENDIYTTSLCHRTREMNIAFEDIQILDELTKN